MSGVRRKLIAFFTFIGGLYFFLEFILPNKIGEFQFGYYHEEILKGVQIIGVMAIGLGIWSILKVHGGNLIKRKEGALNSAVLLGGFFTMLFFQYQTILLEREISSVRMKLDGYSKYIEIILAQKQNESSKKKLDLLLSSLTHLEGKYQEVLGGNSDVYNALAEVRSTLVPLGQEQTADDERKTVAARANSSLAFLKSRMISILEKRNENNFSRLGEQFLNNGVFIPLGSAIFSLLGFYIASAAYRSFRIRSRESSFLMFTAVVVMLGQIPQGSLYISSELPEIRRWILQNMTTPAFRAIYFGSLVAGFAMALRVWLSLDLGELSKGTKGSKKGEK